MLPGLSREKAIEDYLFPAHTLRDAEGKMVIGTASKVTTAS